MKYSFKLIYIEKGKYLQEIEKNFFRMFGVGEEGMMGKGREGRKQGKRG